MTNSFQYRAFKFVSSLVCFLPYSFLAPVSKVLGWLYYRVATKQRDRAIFHIKEHLDVTDKEAVSIIRKSFDKMAMTFLEVLYMPALDEKIVEKYVVFENREYLEEAIAEGKGVIIVSAHMGNWEWFEAILSLVGFQMSAIVKNQPNEEHTRLLNEYRQMFGIETYASGTTEIVKAGRALKKGRALGFLVDQDAAKEGFFMDFMGEMASTHVGAAYFARKFKSPILPGFITRRPEGGHKIIFFKSFHFEANTGDIDQDIYDITEKINKYIIDAIKEHPDEWLWFKRRWDTQYQGDIFNRKNRFQASEE